MRILVKLVTATNKIIDTPINNFDLYDLEVVVKSLKIGLMSKPSEARKIIVAKKIKALLFKLIFNKTPKIKKIVAKTMSIILISQNCIPKFYHQIGELKNERILPFIFFVPEFFLLNYRNHPELLFVRFQASVQAML